MRITVIVSDTEYATIKDAAGLIPLSAFLKRAVLDCIEYDLGRRGKNGAILYGKRRAGESALAAKGGSAKNGKGGK
jgi:hypothetical protein